MRRLAVSAVAAGLLVLAGYFPAGQGARAAGPNPDAFSIDMNPARAPANTATALGSRQACARMNENNTLDADEDLAADTVAVDVTVTNIPASNPMITFAYALNYDETALTVQTADHNFLLFSNNGNDLGGLNASEPLPDTNNDGAWRGSVIDTSDFNVIPPESGSGVLSRLTISSEAGAATGTYPLTLTEAAVIDTDTSANPPDTINNASVALNERCPLVQGDVDCSGSVQATDALKVLRHVAGLGVFQSEPCPDIGTGGPPAMGNVDCSTTGDPVSATDALKILRYVAGLPVAQYEPCNDIDT